MIVQPKYPKVKVRLSNKEKHFRIIEECQRAALSFGVPPEEVKAFRDESLSEKSEGVLLTAKKWFNIF